MPLFGAATEILVRFVQAKADRDLPEDAHTAALARFLSTVASGMGVIASCQALREVARVSLGLSLGTVGTERSDDQGCRQAPLRSDRIAVGT